MQSDRNLIEVLAVNCPVEGAADDVEMTLVVSTAAALDVIRRRHLDLLLTGTEVDGTPIWAFIQKLRRVRPKLQWWLVARGIDPADECVARTLGVARLLETVPTAKLISVGLARRTADRGEQQLEPAGLVTANEGLETIASTRPIVASRAGRRL